MIYKIRVPALPLRRSVNMLEIRFLCVIPWVQKNNDSPSEKQAIVIFYTMFTLPSIENLCNGGVRGEDDGLVPALHGEFQGVQAPDKGIKFLFRGIVIGF